MKQTYHLVKDPNEGDASFKLCICTMLLMASIFGFFLVIFFVIKPSEKDTSGSNSNAKSSPQTGSNQVENDQTRNSIGPTTEPNIKVFTISNVEKGKQVTANTVNIVTEKAITDVFPTTEKKSLLTSTVEYNSGAFLTTIGSEATSAVLSTENDISTTYLAEKETTFSTIEKESLFNNWTVGDSKNLISSLANQTTIGSETTSGTETENNITTSTDSGENQTAFPSTDEATLFTSGVNNSTNLISSLANQTTIGSETTSGTETENNIITSTDSGENQTAFPSTDETTLFTQGVYNSTNLISSYQTTIGEPLSSTTPRTSSPVAETKPGNSNECQTNHCYTVASRMLSLLNINADPCENFYNYACGGLLNNPLLLEEDLSVDVFARIKMAVKSIASSSSPSYKKFKNFYDGCVDYDKLVLDEERKRQGQEVLNRIGQFVMPGQFDLHDLNITQLIKALLQHGSAPLIDVQFDVHSDNPSQFQLVITPPDFLKFSFSSHFVTPKERKQHCLKTDDNVVLDTVTAFNTFKVCMDDFSTFIEESTKALQFFEVYKNMTDGDASKFISETLGTLKDILTILKNCLDPQKTQRGIQMKSFMSFKVNELQDKISMVNWTYLFQDAGKDEKELQNTTVKVYSSDILEKVFVELEHIDKRTMYNALLAIFAHDLFIDIVTTKHWSSRDHYCLQVASSLMPLVASNLYLGTFSPDIERSLRNQTQNVFENLKKEMGNKIKKVMSVESAWLTDQSKTNLEDKLELMKIILPLNFSEDSLNTSLKGCLGDSIQYIRDSICLLQQFQTPLYQHLSLNPNSSEVMWAHFLTAFSTKTVFVHSLNTFMVPLTVLAPLNFDEQMPQSVILATLGNLLGRGIGHNFDHAGVQFSADGKHVYDWILLDSSKTVYKNMEIDIDMRYNNELSHLEDDHNYKYKLEGDIPWLSLNERLSDLTAANLSWWLHQEKDSLLPWVGKLGFDSRKVYFLALTQRFCTKKKVPETFQNLYEETSLPSFERVNTLVSNLELFSETFNCPTGSNMNNNKTAKPFPMLKELNSTYNSPEPY